MRAPVDHIAAPPFPRKLPWINVAMLRMDQQLGRPVLVEFWDFCRPNSIRTLPYISSWHQRYEAHGLRVIGVHTSGFEPSEDLEAVRAACRRLGIEYPVVVDTEREIWEDFGNLGWPARYLFDQRGMLFEYHYGEGGYAETEAAIQELLEIEEPLLDPLRAEDAPGALLEPQSPDIEGPYTGSYRAGEVWAVLSGTGTVTAAGRSLQIDHPGCYQLICHPQSTQAELDLDVGDGVTCHAICFIPGLARSAAPPVGSRRAG
jgi:thiol-disulfide isomerase/thioredoxin